MKRWQSLLLVAGLLCPVVSTSAGAAPAKKATVPVKNEGWRITYGSPKAKVLVQAFYPIHETGGAHHWVKQYSRDLAAAYPGKVRAIAYDFTSSKGGEEWQRLGLTCGCFVVNGKVRSTYQGKQIAFVRGPHIAGWSFAQLKAVVGQAVATAYGGSAAPPAASGARPTAAGTRKETVDVAVPCGLAGPYGEIVRLFRAQHPNVTLRPQVSGLVAMRNQLRDGRVSANVYLALGARDVTQPPESKHLALNSMVRCATVPLAVVVPKDNPAGIRTLEDLASPRVKTIVTYSFDLAGGRGARQALQKAGVWDAVASKVITPKVPDQAKQMVKMGKADAAIVYRTCLMESYEPDQPPVKEENLTAVITLPLKLYDAVEVGGVVLQGDKQPAGASQFVQFLGTPQARQVWIRWGFEPPVGTH